MTNNNAWYTSPNRDSLGFKLRPFAGTLARVACFAMLAVATSPRNAAGAEQLRAGAAKVDITNREAGPVNDPLYAKALVIRSAATTAVIVTVDAVAIGEIGYIDNAYLGKVRSQVERELKIPPSNVIVNASHCHGIVCKDVDERTLLAIKQASEKMVPVRIGVGLGHEDRVKGTPIY